MSQLLPPGPMHPAKGSCLTLRAPGSASSTCLMHVSLPGPLCIRPLWHKEILYILDLFCPVRVELVARMDASPAVGGLRWVLFTPLLLHSPDAPLKSHRPWALSMEGQRSTTGER